MLNESELQYVKKLLILKNHEYWKESSNLVDVYRHCKYTIRKIARQMAGLETFSMFKRLKEPNLENTIQLVYRVENMFQARADAEKIMKFVAIAQFDETRINNIITTQSIRKEDLLFLSKNEIFLKRIQTQQKIFMTAYKIFGQDFDFKRQPFSEYIQGKINRVTVFKEM
jgi:hypothetical protein